MLEEKFLTKDDIFLVNDLPEERVSVPEWGGTIIIRGLTASERDEFEAQIFTGEGKGRKFNHKDLRARLLSLTICDEKGEHLFDDADIAKLGRKSGKVAERLFSIAQRLSGIGQTDLEELLKNSKGGQPD